MYSGILVYHAMHSGILHPDVNVAVQTMSVYIVVQARY